MNFWKNINSLIFFALGIGLGALAGLVNRESLWNTPLLIGASILMLVGFFLEFKSTPKSPGYRLYQSGKYLSVKDFCKEVIYIRRGDVKVAVQKEVDGKLLVTHGNNRISTDGVTDNVLVTAAGKLTVTKLKGGYRVSWDKGIWVEQ